MQCTPQEIELKRKKAQLKLQSKHQNGISGSPLKNVMSPTSNNSPGKTFTFKPYEKPKPAIPFYGKTNVITGTCYLISEDRFAVDLSTFHNAAVTVFKTIPSRSYNTKTRIWDFHVKDYGLLQNKLTDLQPEIVVGKIPKYALNCCTIPKPDYDKIDLSKIDQELVNALMPFQREGVCFGIDKNGRCLIADDMGLGKTFQALAIANYYQEEWPLLIATTASMKNVWEETIHKNLPSISIMETQYMITTKDYIGDAKILIVSHDLMSRCVDNLLNHNFGVLIIDESHMLKNFKAKCTKAALELAKKAKRVVLLSGTPALSRPSELFSQLSLIDSKFFGSFFDYSKRYCNGKTSPFGWDASGKSNLQELEIVLAKKFMIRRTKADVLKSMPDKIQEVVTLDVNLSQFSDEDRKCLTALATKYKREKSGGSKHAALLVFFAETAKIKIPSVCSYILQVLDTSNKFLVFAHHQKMLDAIQKVLEKKNKNFIRIDGNSTSDQRKYLVDKFQFDDNVVCGILSITAANAGITLTAAQLIIFAELHWNPSILNQAESRAHRIGQSREVVVKYLLAPGTADDSIWPLLLEKQKVLKEVGLSKDSFNNVSVTKQDLKSREPIAECLNSSVTEYNTLDITSYFKSPEKSNKEINDNSFMCAENKSCEMDYFDDDFDDILSSVNIDV